MKYITLPCPWPNTVGSVTWVNSRYGFEEFSWLCRCEFTSVSAYTASSYHFGIDVYKTRYLPSC